MKLRHVAAVTLPALLLGSSAEAVRKPDHLDERSIETAQGPRGRASRVTTWRTPDAARTAWGAFVTRRGPWRALWDGDTAVPLRLFGKGIDVPGASASAATAESAALRVLEDELALLAPGASLADFVPAANVVHGAGALRTVSFWQTHHGARIVGASVSFLFKNDRLFVIGSTAARDVAVALPSPVPRSVSETASLDWIQDVYGGSPTVLAVSDMVVLPIVRERDDGLRPTEYRVVIPVTVDLLDPRGRWTVYVDAERGTPVARTQLLRFGDGTVNYKVPVRYPLGDKADFAALYATHSVSGQSVTANLGGVVTWSGTAAATVTAGLLGTYVRINNQAGAEASTQLTLPNGGSVTWDQTTSERADAQLAAFIHANLIKEYARTTIDPDMDWLYDRLEVYVNEGGNCNAYSTGDDIHFYVRSTQCENTARLADVVYHEFGHSIHNHAIIPGAGEWDGALSEGISDYLAATYTNDHGMGRGFFHSDAPMRDINPANGEKVWPDDLTGEVHDDGEIIAGTLWDLRAAMMASLGDSDGRTKADDLWHAIISRASDIPSSYVEALAGDDDDGDLSNGTPHKCLIDQVFSAHGLADGGEAAGGSVAPPTLRDLTLTLDVGSTDGVCPPPPVESAVATWRLRAEPATTGTVDFGGSGDTLTATLPVEASGQVVQYQVAVTFADDSTQTFPKNPADPWYETYVGPVTVLYCMDFETDPTLDGWTLGTGFAWGPPAATGNASDPASAYSGAAVIGSDLGADGGDGNYEPSVSETAQTPEIAIEGDWDGIRLQYRRWLNVEDATYDHATIAVDGDEVWSNLETAAEDTHHRDREWRFQDVDVTTAAADGLIRVEFGLDADGGLEFGGWTIDDFCIVAIGAGRCGDSLVTPPEECDDGNDTDGDGCSASCTGEGDPDGGPGGGGDDDDDGGGGGSPTGGCCSAGGDGVTGPIVVGLGTLLLVLRRRRRI